MISQDGALLTCELFDDSHVGAGWEVALRKNGELVLGKRCWTRALTHYPVGLRWRLRAAPCGGLTLDVRTDSGHVPVNDDRFVAFRAVEHAPSHGLRFSIEARVEESEIH